MSKQTKKNTSAKPAGQAPPAPKKPSPSGPNHLGIAGGLAAFAFLLYANTFGHDYVLDDPLVTTLNKFVQQGFGGLIDIFTHSYRAGSSISTDSEYMYRPLSVATFAAEWAIAPNAPGFHHFMNVLWYALTAGLLYLTLTKILSGKHNLFIIGAIALYLVHPLHTEVVANIKSRDEILSFFFSLLCLNWFWEDAENGITQKRWLSLGAFFLALLAKEGAMTLLVLCPMVLYFFGNNRSAKEALVRSVWLIIPFVLWLIIRYLAMNGKMSYTPDFNDNQLVAATASDRFATCFEILGKYLGLLVWPAALSWDYSFNEIPTIGWGDWRALLSLAIHGALLVYALMGFKERRFSSFCILAYFVSMALYSNMVLMIGTMLGERLTYVSSLWFALGIAYLVWTLLKMPATRAPAQEGLFAAPGALRFSMILAVLILAMGYRTVQRNGEWKNNYTLFTADQHSAPSSFRTQRAAAEQYLLKYAANPAVSDSANLLNQSAALFQKSIDIRPTNEAYIGLGNVAICRKNYAKSVEHLRGALQMAPNSQIAKERMKTAYREWGIYEGQVKRDLPKAVEYLSEALRYDSTDSPTLRALGTAYGLQNSHAQAVACFEKALQKEPNDKDIMRNLSVGYRLLGNTAKADEYARKSGN